MVDLAGRAIRGHCRWGADGSQSRVAARPLGNGGIRRAGAWRHEVWARLHGGVVCITWRRNRMAWRTRSDPMRSPWPRLERAASARPTGGPKGWRTRPRRTPCGCPSSRGCAGRVPWRPRRLFARVEVAAIAAARDHLGGSARTGQHSCWKAGVSHQGRGGAVTRRCRISTPRPARCRWPPRRHEPPLGHVRSGGPLRRGEPRVQAGLGSASPAGVRGPMRRGGGPLSAARRASQRSGNGQSACRMQRRPPRLRVATLCGHAAEGPRPADVRPERSAPSPVVPSVAPHGAPTCAARRGLAPPLGPGRARARVAALAA